MIPLLAALQYAPTVFEAGRKIYAAVTGKEAAETPEQLADDVKALPPEQREQVAKQILDARTEAQRMDSQRFALLTDGDADKVRSTARPQIALRCMAMMEVFSRAFYLLIVATLIHWLANWILAAFQVDLVVPSPWAALAAAEPVAEMIWAPLLASFYAAIAVIKKYMGCRERDKAQEYEIKAGRPLSSSASTIEAAGGAVASLVKAFKGR